MSELKSGDVCLLRHKWAAQSNTYGDSDWSVRVFPKNTIFDVHEGANRLGVVLVRPHGSVEMESFKIYHSALKRLGWLELLAVTGLGLDPDLDSQTAIPGSDITEHDG